MELTAANDNLNIPYGPFPPTMRIAMRLSSKYYFTGRPCVRGHVAHRRTDSGSCVPCNSARSAAWAAANPEKNRAHVKLWQDANKDQRKARRAVYVEANKDKIAARSHERYLEDRERKILGRREWQRKNPEKVAAYKRNRRAASNGADGSHTVADVKAILALQNNRCAECNVLLSTTGYHVDQIMPLSKGGSNWPRNLQILCPTCNMEKHATDPIVFAQRKGRLL